MFHPLLYCITSAKIQLVQTLLRCGADPEQTNDKGVKPLDYAKLMHSKTEDPDIRARHEKIITILEEAIARKNNPDSAEPDKKKKKKKKS
jgi:hypothetical protein